MAWEHKVGQMVPNMQDSGLMEKLMVMVNFFIITMIHTKAILQTIEQMEKASTYIQMAEVIKENLKMIFNMDKVKNFTRMEVNTMVNLNSAKGMVKEYR